MLKYKCLCSFLMLYPFLVVAEQPQNWEIRKLDDATIIAQNNGHWGVFFSGSEKEAVFCFAGPFQAIAGKTQTAKLKVGTGPWFDAPLVGYDHETLCAMDTKKAQGLLGAMIAHGSISFGITQHNKFDSVKFDASNLSDMIKRKQLIN